MAKLLAKHGRDHRLDGSDPIPDPDWIYVGTYPTDPNTTADSPPFQSSWANLGGNYPPLRFKKDIAGFIHLEGAITGGSDGTVVFTLPTGYTPARSLRFLGALSTGSDFLTLQVDPTGEVWVVATGYAPADGSIPVGKISTAGGSDGDVLQIVSGAAVWGPDPGGTASITIQQAGTLVGTEPKINFSGSGVTTVTATDDGVNSRVNVQVGISPGSAGQVLTTSGGAVVWAAPTGSGSSVDAQHNDVDVATEPALDFEDGTLILFSVTDDSANSRVKVGAGIAAGTSGQVLTTSSGGAVVWADPTGGISAIDVQHNDVDVASEATLDFEDSGVIAITVTDDSANSRIKITPAITAGTDGEVLTTTGSTVGWAAPAAPKKHLVLTWFGAPPTSVPALSQVLRVPYNNGASMTFNLDRLTLRMETAGTSSTAITLQKSPGGGAFSPTSIGTASLASGVHEDDETTGLGSVSSGDLVRVDWTAVGTGAASYSIEMEATET